MSILVLMRHGESDAGFEKRFAGWADVPLSEEGRRQAVWAGRGLAATGIVFDEFHTSTLSRALETMRLVRGELQPCAVETRTSWLLNERHYGALQGCERREAVESYGAERVTAWRRDFHAVPPLLDATDPRHPSNDPAYSRTDPGELPSGESLAQAAERCSRWWHQITEPALRDGANILVVAHTATLRGFTRAIEGLSDTAAADFRVATALPFVYEFGVDLRLVDKRELDLGVKQRFRQWRSKIKPTRLLPWI